MVALRSDQYIKEKPDVPNITSANTGSLLDGEPNLTTSERGAYIIAGLGLAAAGVKPRPNPLLNVLALLGGSYLAWRGYVGNCPVKAAIVGSNGSSERIQHEG
jgi:uncharacterized membrane protein